MPSQSKSLWIMIKEALHHAGCRYCRKPLDRKIPRRRFCNACMKNLSFRPLSPTLRQGDFHLYAATTFNLGLKRLLYGYKFYNQQEYACVLADILIEYWENFLTEYPSPLDELILTSIPPRTGEKKRLAPILSRFSDHFGYCYEPGLLVWQRTTLPQHTLFQKQARHANMKDCFQVPVSRSTALQRRFSKLVSNSPERLKSPEFPPTMKTPLVVTVDDITTTGATLREAVQTLHQALIIPDSCSIIGLAITALPLSRNHFP